MALILSSPVKLAKEKTSDDENWGEWQGLGEGYVARRRQPPKLDLPKYERRLANVQARVKKLLKKSRSCSTAMKKPEMMDIQISDIH